MKAIALIARTEIRNVAVRIVQYVENEGLFEDACDAGKDVLVTKTGKTYDVWLLLQDGRMKLSKSEAKLMINEMKAVANGIEYAVKHHNALVPASLTVEQEFLDQFINVRKFKLID